MDKPLVENLFIVSCSLPAILPGVMYPLSASRIGKVAIAQNPATIVIVPEVANTNDTRIGCQVELFSVASVRNCESNVIVRGSSRVRLQDSGLAHHPQNLVTVTDVYDTSPRIDRTQRRTELCEAFCDRFPQFSHQWFVTPLLERDLPFGKLCDLLAFACELTPKEHVKILEETNVDRRSDLVLAMLDDQSRTINTRHFPPQFSWN